MSTVERQALLPKDWLVQYQPRWWQWRLKKKTLWVKHTFAFPEYIGYSLGIATATKSEAIKCDHFDKFIGIMIPQSGELGKVCESAQFAFCPKCGEKL